MAQFTYKDKYLFTGTIRRDGSSAFGRTNRCIRIIFSLWQTGHLS